MKVKVLVYPKDPNPYQELLYRNMIGANIGYMQELTPSRTLNLVLIPALLVVYRILGYRILHLHWLYPFHLSSKSTFLMLLSEAYFRAFLTLVNAMRYRLVWTAHNIVPHEKTFMNDQKVIMYLATQADKIIFLNKHVSETYAKNHPEIASKISVIPQGNYLDYYDFGNTESDNSKLVFGFVGRIERYKGLHLLIPIIRRVNNPDIRLRVIGKCIDKIYLRQLHKLASSDNRITIENRFIENDDLGKHISSFGMFVLPYTDITNSSSAMLAFSAGRPILTPRIGGMEDYPKDTGVYYEDGDLAGAINTALDMSKSWNILGKNALSFAKKNDWKMFSKKTVKIYSDMVC